MSKSKGVEAVVTQQSLEKVVTDMVDQVLNDADYADDLTNDVIDNLLYGNEFRQIVRTIIVSRLAAAKGEAK